MFYQVLLRISPASSNLLSVSNVQVHYKLAESYQTQPMTMTTMGVNVLFERYEQVKSLEVNKNDLIEVNFRTIPSSSTSDCSYLHRRTCYNG